MRVLEYMADIVQFTANRGLFQGKSLLASCFFISQVSLAVSCIDSPPAYPFLVFPLPFFPPCSEKSNMKLPS